MPSTIPRIDENGLSKLLLIDSQLKSKKYQILISETCNSIDTKQVTYRSCIDEIMHNTMKYAKYGSIEFVNDEKQTTKPCFSKYPASIQVS